MVEATGQISSGKHMKYYSTLPITALIAVSVMYLLVAWQVIPPGSELLTGIQGSLSDYFFPVVMLIILLESIVYIGFYFPGQFFAVLLVIGSQPTLKDVFWLTIAMVLAATLGSFINYNLGKFSSLQKTQKTEPAKLKHLLLAMIHMNSLAFFMFAQGATRRPVQIVWLAGLLNLPYYLVLITATSFLSEEVMHIAENTALLLILLFSWLMISLFLDIKQARK